MFILFNNTSKSHRLHITYNNNIVGYFMKIQNKIFLWCASIQLMASICFRIGLEIDGLILVLRFEILLSNFAKIGRLPMS